MQDVPFVTLLKISPSSLVSEINAVLGAGPAVLGCVVAQLTCFIGWCRHCPLSWVRAGQCDVQAQSIPYCGIPGCTSASAETQAGIPMASWAWSCREIPRARRIGPLKPWEGLSKATGECRLPMLSSHNGSRCLPQKVAQILPPTLQAPFGAFVAQGIWRSLWALCCHKSSYGYTKATSIISIRSLSIYTIKDSILW